MHQVLSDMHTVGHKTVVFDYKDTQRSHVTVLNKPRMISHTSTFKKHLKCSGSEKTGFPY